MKNFSSALLSSFIIDGVPQALSPIEMLNDVSIEKLPVEDCSENIADETPDPELKSCSTDAEHMHYYLNKVAATCRQDFPFAFSESYTNSLIERELIDTLWKDGHFRLQDLALNARWEWCDGGLGRFAAFYWSCAAAADFIDALGIHLQRYSVIKGGDCRLTFTPTIAHSLPEAYDDITGELLDDPSGKAPRLGRKAAVPGQIVPDPESWLIFIPFDTCEFRLGGSLFSDVIKGTPDPAPEVGDADYFMDCFELVRELSEDGILLSAGTVGEGGLLSALRHMNASCGACINLADIKKTYNEKDSIRIIFSEVPGAIIQIRDIDFDYIDAEMLLQDIVYFPLGHPDTKSRDITVLDTGKTSIESILESLIRSQSSEGED